MRIGTLFLAVGLGVGFSVEARATENARQVVIMVWDGMRPDFVNETNTPALFELAKRGVTFRRHHPVYPSSTEVNGTAFATGSYPAHDGIVGNNEYRPEI